MNKLNIPDKSISSLNLKQIRPQGNGDFEIYRINKALVPGNKMFLTPHRRNYYQFVFVNEGNSSFWVDFHYHSFKPGGLYFTGPSQLFVKDVQLPMEGIILSFTKEFLQMATQLNRLPILNSNEAYEFRSSIKERKEIEHTLIKILDEFAKQDELSALSLISYLGIFLVQISRLYNKLPAVTGTPLKGKTITDFFNLVNAEFSKYHLVAEYAALLNITPGHLNELVKKYTGKTAILCIQERLTLEAKYMLFHTTDSIKGIAYSLGFNEAAYFSKFFKRLAGITPEEYRKNTLEICSRTPEMDNS
ncbi:helix-turn-helix domain-containing protein [Pedobacter cryoconitis]|uniref:helix-turn-helix domain-containing protein n=1 Tax=Pedobacter cryoconitis TaxID=188932 RepID=UPI001620D4D4|nr:helix-turn-helix domain-containing protein [Pedobacter cryoconitis]MBB5646470.1 AraC-like DNA-binding protein [Pedobacter cryoconitis]